MPFDEMIDSCARHVCRCPCAIRPTLAPDECRLTVIATHDTVIANDLVTDTHVGSPGLSDLSRKSARGAGQDEPAQHGAVEVDERQHHRAPAGEEVAEAHGLPVLVGEAEVERQLRPELLDDLHLLQRGRDLRLDRRPPVQRLP